jgi:hypothetical protein
MNHKYEYMYCFFENMYVLLDLDFREWKQFGTFGVLTL